MEVISLFENFITVLWTLVNIGAVIAVIIVVISLCKYLSKSDKPKKESDVKPHSASPKV